MLALHRKGCHEWFPFITFCHPRCVAHGQVDELILTNRQWGPTAGLNRRSLLNQQAPMSDWVKLLTDAKGGIIQEEDRTDNDS